MLIYLGLIFLFFAIYVPISHLLTKGDPNKTNNLIMFQCQIDILNNSPDHEVEVREFIHDWYRHEGKEIKQNFSLDNWQMVICWAKKFKPELIDLVPIFGRHSWRPDIFFFILWAKYKWVGWIFLPFPILGMIYSMARVWKTNKHGLRYIDTDGKLISYFKIDAFGFPITSFILEQIIKWHPDLQSWENLFKIYYPSDHFVLAGYLRQK